MTGWLLVAAAVAAPTRFVALGDAGTGSDTQEHVAQLITEVCARPDRGCDFVLYLGDNFYDNGVSSPYDPKWRTHFEEPYRHVEGPFFPVLGNHDVKGEHDLDLAWDKGSHQVAYTALSDKWVMPAFYYQVPPNLLPSSDVGVWGLHTTEIFFSDWFETQQGDWLDEQLDASEHRWRIVFGHHPYISNGRHGDAGAYDASVPGMCSTPMVKLACGLPLQTFFEEHVCGRVDLVLAGHDHDKQWLGEQCGTHWAVSGAGAKMRGPGLKSHEVVFEDHDHPGFLWVGIDGGSLEAWFYGLPEQDGESPIEDGPFTIIK